MKKLVFLFALMAATSVFAKQRQLVCNKNSNENQLSMQVKISDVNSITENISIKTIYADGTGAPDFSGQISKNTLNLTDKNGNTHSLYYISEAGAITKGSITDKSGTFELIEGKGFKSAVATMNGFLILLTCKEL